MVQAISRVCVSRYVKKYVCRLSEKVLLKRKREPSCVIVMASYTLARAIEWTILIRKIILLAEH